MIKECFCQQVPSLSFSIVSTPSSTYSCIVCDLGCSCPVAYSSLFSFSSSIYCISYREKEIRISLYCQCQIVYRESRLDLTLSSIERLHRDEQEEVEYDEQSECWKWKGCCTCIPPLQLSQSFSMQYTTVSLVSSILAQECCKVGLVGRFDCSYYPSPCFQREKL